MHKRGCWFLNDLLKANSFSFINSNTVEAKIKIVYQAIFTMPFTKYVFRR